MKVRFAPSATRSLHIGNALGGTFLLRIDVTDPDDAREPASSALEAPSLLLPGERETLERFGELRAGANGALDKETAKEIVRELKAVGGNLRAVRRVLTGCESGPELWSVLAALPRDETLRKIDAAL